MNEKQKPIFCEECAHYKGDGEHCIDNLTIGISGIPLSECLGFELRRSEVKRDE